MRSQDIITSIQEMSEITYTNRPADERLAFRVGMLQSQIIQLCIEIDEKNVQINELQKEIMWLKKNSM